MLNIPFKDNPVNMMLLATYMKKNDWEFEKATNGLIALQAFQHSPEGFDVIFMGTYFPYTRKHTLCQICLLLITPRSLIGFVCRCFDARNDRLRIHSSHSHY
jgi:phage terminase large subunit-like protein